MPVLSRPFAAPQPEQLEGVSTFGEAFDASVGETLATGPTGGAWNALRVWATDAAGFDAPLFQGPMLAGNPLSGFNVSKSPVVAPEEAKQLAKDAGVESDLPLQKYPDGIRRSTLNLLIDLNQQKQKRQTLMAGYDGWAPGVAGMLVGSIIDPANVALSFVPVVGEARYAQLLKNAGGAFGRAGVRSGVGAAEGLVGSVLAEPLIYAGQQQWRNDYDAYDSMLNIAGGAVFGSLLHAGVGLVRDIHGNPEPIEIRKPELPKQEPVELRPANDVPAPEVRQPVLERVVPDEFIATTKAGEFRLVDKEAVQGRDFSEFGQIREVTAYAGDRQVGNLIYANDGTPPTIEVDPEFQRQGIGTAMLKLAKERGGVLGKADTGVSGSGRPTYRTDEGHAFRTRADESTVTLRERTETVPAPKPDGPATHQQLANALEPTPAEREFVASLEQSTQAAAMRQAVTQMIEGRPLDVTPAMLADPKFAADPQAYRTAVERANYNGTQTDGANVRASQEVDAQLAESEPDVLTFAKESLADEQARVKAAGAEPETLDDDLKLTTDAVKAMTMCMMRSNG
jgi:GNAT superfamily N-acetyltransferase